MKKPFFAVLTVFTAGALFAGNLAAQQTAPSNTPPAAPAPATKSSTSTTPKSGSTTAKKAPAPPLELKTDKDKLSYALGMGLGENLRKQSVDVNTAIVMRGLKDAIAGKPMLTEEQEHTAITQLQNDLKKKQEAKAAEQGITDKKEGDAFLAQNKTQEGVVTLPSGLQYKILKEGTGPKPTASDTVSVLYKGTLVNGTEFDSSAKHGDKPASFRVGGVIKGFTEALELMPVGSKWQIVLPPDLAYGDHGAGPTIGPNSTLIFELELVSIQPPAPPPAATPSAAPAPAPAKPPAAASVPAQPAQPPTPKDGTQK